MPKLRPRIKAAEPGGDTPSRFEMYPGVDYEQDDQVHAPPTQTRAPAVDKKNPDQGFLREPKGRPADDDLVLTQPIKYIVDPNDAIEKMEALTRKVVESRPDLAPQVAVVDQALQQLEQGSRGQGMAQHELAEGEVPVAEVFNPGDKVTVVLEDGTYQGKIEKANEDGTFVVHTDQAMSLQNVPAEAIKRAEVTEMTLPASLKKRIEAARMVTDTIAQAFAEGKKRRVANTSTDGRTIWLHNNAIARKTGDGGVEISLAGWPTATTRERLNGLMQALGINKRVSQRGGNQMLDGKPWDGEWIAVGSVDPAEATLGRTGEMPPAENPPLAASRKVLAEELEEVEDYDAEAEGPSPEDYTISDCGHLGGKYCVGQVEGKFLGEFVEWEDAARAIREKMDKEKFWPNVWYISDHGNVSLADISASTKIKAVDEFVESIHDKKGPVTYEDDGSEVKVGDIVEFTYGRQTWPMEELPEDTVMEAKVVKAGNFPSKMIQVQPKQKSYLMTIHVEDVTSHRSPVQAAEAVTETPPAEAPAAQQWFVVERKWSDGNDSSADSDVLVQAKDSGDALDKVIASVQKDFNKPAEEEDSDEHSHCFMWFNDYSDDEESGWVESYTLHVQGPFASEEEAHKNTSKFHGTPWTLEAGASIGTGEGRLDMIAGKPRSKKAGKKLAAKLKARAEAQRVKAAPATMDKPAASAATAPTTEQFAQPAKAKAGYEPTGVKIVEEGGSPRAFDPAKDDVKPAELLMNDKGQLGLANPSGETTYEDQAGDPLEQEYWKLIRTLAPAPKAEAAPADDKAAQEKANVENYAKKAGVKAAARTEVGDQVTFLDERGNPNSEKITGKVTQVSADGDITVDSGGFERVIGVEDIVDIKLPSEVQGRSASAKATALAARAKVKAAKSKVKASAFDEIEEIEIGGGFKARRKAKKNEGAGQDEETLEIEVVDADGKVKETFPDAFGDDTVMIIKFLRKVLDIKETDDKKAAKKESKGEGGESDIAEKPKALPAVKDDKKEDEEKAKEEAVEASKRFEAKAETCRGIATRLLRAGHIQASLEDVDNALLAGKTLAEAQVVAAKKAVDMKVMDLIAQPEEELLIIRASLPHLEARRVTVPASEGGLGPINLSASGVIDVSAQQGMSLGAAFGRGFHR